MDSKQEIQRQKDWFNKRDNVSDGLRVAADEGSIYGAKGYDPVPDMLIFGVSAVGILLLILGVAYVVRH